MNNMKCGLTKFLGLLVLLSCIGFPGCASLQTKPTCRILRSGTIDFYNYSWKTNPYARAIVCKINDLGEHECGNPFWLKKYHIWFRVDEGLYYVEIVSRTKLKAFEVAVAACENVKVEFR